MGLTFGADTPEDDFGLVDHEPRGMGRLQARSMPNGAVHIGDGTATAADQMVMVIADTRLKKRRGTGGFDTSHQPGTDTGPEHVINGLRGHPPQIGAHDHRDDVCGRMWMRRNSVQNRYAWGRDTQSRPAQCCVGGGGLYYGHSTSMRLFWNESRNGFSRMGR